MKSSLLVVALLLSCVTRASAQSELVHLRPIDRATVRVLSLSGLDPEAAAGRRTRQRRVEANALTAHGSGVAITPRVVLTARHVVWGADSWVVIPPGSSTPIAARPIYVDVDDDFAFLALDADVSEHVRLPEDRTLTLSERVSVSGYPLDLREPTPAAASGEVSRVTRRGELHLTMTVNPGHSGGPVIDGEGRVVGIVSARGRMDRGVEGLAVAVPLAPILAARERLPSELPAFEQYDRDLAAGIAWIAHVGERPLLEEREAILPVVQRALTWPTADPDRDAILAALAWNTMLELLEAAGVPTVDAMTGADAPVARMLRSTAIRLARNAIQNGPHVRRRFPVVRNIGLGREVAPEPSTPY